MSVDSFIESFDYSLKKHQVIAITIVIDPKDGKAGLRIHGTEFLLAQLEPIISNHFKPTFFERVIGYLHEKFFRSVSKRS